MRCIAIRIKYLQQVVHHYETLAQYHAGRVSQLYRTNPEQAEAHWGQNLFWIERAGRVGGKLAVLSDLLTARIRQTYEPRSKA